MTAVWPSKEKDRAFFPLKTVGQVRKLFEAHLTRADKQPNLAFLSIVAGYIENTLTQGKESLAFTAAAAPVAEDEVGGCGGEDVTNVNLALEPQVSWHLVEALMTKFEATVRGFCEVDLLTATRTASTANEVIRNKRKLIKHIADIVWNTLTKSQYKADRPHLQSIYSYLTGNKLDCFGVAYAVVAACQLLEFPDVHLAMSEDHAWVVFGDDLSETAEVTWHGKGSEDKRGQPVEPLKAKTSWLYVAGKPTVCISRAMEVAAMVSAINPAVNSGTDSLEVGALQQELLWLLYDLKHLSTFPLAIGNLADLEEMCPSLGRPNCLKLYEECVDSDRTHYHNHHVYPHTYQGGYFYRHKQFKKAIQSWANAAQVMKLYNYSKDDEEIYKEFMEIANDFIPHIVKSQGSNGSGLTPGESSAPLPPPPRPTASEASSSNLLKDPEAFASVLRFYDGLCCWEEGSPTPIMHIGWAKPMVATMSKFDAEVRHEVAGIDDDDEDGEDEATGDSKRGEATEAAAASADQGDEEGNKLFKSPQSSSLLSCSHVTASTISPSPTLSTAAAAATTLASPSTASTPSLLYCSTPDAHGRQGTPTTPVPHPISPSPSAASATSLVSPSSTNASNVSPLSSASMVMADCLDHECFQKLEFSEGANEASEEVPDVERCRNNSSNSKKGDESSKSNGDGGSNNNYKECDIRTSNEGKSECQKEDDSCDFQPKAGRAATPTEAATQQAKRTTDCDISKSQEENVSLASLRRRHNRRKNRKYHRRSKSVIDSLGKACHSHLLSLDYLLGQSGKPFDNQSNPLDTYSKKPAVGLTPMAGAPPPPPAAAAAATLDLSRSSCEGLYVDCGSSNDFFPVSDKRRRRSSSAANKDGGGEAGVGGLTLHSVKMKGLQSLLAAEKLNVSAIQLQLTAQSQTASSDILMSATNTSSSSSPFSHSRPKRSRREFC